MDFNPPLILGFSNTGKCITLYNCQLTRTTGNFPGFFTSSLIAERAFIGVHFKATEEIKFKSLSVHYAHLDEWVDKPGFNVDHGEEDRGKLTVRYERPDPVKTKVGDYEIAIVIGQGFSYNRLKQVKITQKAWILFSPEQGRPLDDYLDIIYHVQNFLSLAMTKPTYPLAVHGTTEASRETSADGKERYAPVEILYQVPFLQTEIRPLHSPDILFDLPSIQDQFETYITNWINKADLLKPIYDLYFSTLYNPHMFLESWFLSLTQAIETYHRRRFGGKYQSDEEYRDGLYRKFIEVIPPDLDDGFKQSLKRGKLLYANEFSLRKRLRDITDRLSKELAINFIGLEGSREEFANKVHNTRNYLTHYDPELESKAATGQELYNLTIKLRTLLEMCLLEELGFSFASIRDMTFKHRKYRHVFQLR